MFSEKLCLQQPGSELGSPRESVTSHKAWDTQAPKDIFSVMFSLAAEILLYYSYCFGTKVNGMFVCLYTQVTSIYCVCLFVPLLIQGGSVRCSVGTLI